MRQPKDRIINSTPLTVKEVMSSEIPRTLEVRRNIKVQLKVCRVGSSIYCLVLPLSLHHSCVAQCLDSSRVPIYREKMGEQLGSGFLMFAMNQKVKIKDQ